MGLLERGRISKLRVPMTPGPTKGSALPRLPGFDRASPLVRDSPCRVERRRRGFDDPSRRNTNPSRLVFGFPDRDAGYIGQVRQKSVPDGTRASSNATSPDGSAPGVHLLLHVSPLLSLSPYLCRRDDDSPVHEAIVSGLSVRRKPLVHGHRSETCLFDQSNEGFGLVGSNRIRTVPH